MKKKLYQSPVTEHIITPACAVMQASWDENPWGGGGN